LAGGLASLERASTLDPRSPIIATNHALALVSVGRNDEARARCLEALEIAPTFAGCLGVASLASLMSGDYVAARPQFSFPKPAARDRLRGVVFHRTTSASDKPGYCLLLPLGDAAHSHRNAAARMFLRAQGNEPNPGPSPTNAPANESQRASTYSPGASHTGL
jgi:hypothetical protein